MKNMLIALGCLAALAAPLAQAGAGHDHGPKHGGVVRDAGKLTYELVVKADKMTLHVSDHGKPVAITGAKAEATVHVGSEKIAATLMPTAENTLVAQGSFKTGVGARVEVKVSWQGHPDVKLNFRLK